VVGSVQVQHPGPADQAGGQVQAAAHAARVGLGRPAAGVGQAELIQQLGPPAAGGASGHAEQAADEQEVLGAGEALVDGRVLAGQGDQPADLLGLGDDVVAGHPSPALVRLEQVARIRTAVVLPAPLGPSTASTVRSGPPGRPRRGRWCRQSA
jgi:hypothetical protein